MSDPVSTEANSAPVCVEPRVGARLARLLAMVWRFNALRLAAVAMGGMGARCMVERPLFGYRMALDLARTDVQRLLFMEGERFVEERHLLSRLVEGCHGVVDVGANIGYYLLLFARHAHPASTILCVEPSRENLPELEATIRLNGLDRATVCAAALGAGSGEVGLRSGINSGVTSDPHAAYRVPMTTLDEVVRGAVQFIKVDVEGYEFEVLKGGGRTLAGQPTLFLELHPMALRRHGASVTACVELLRGFYPRIEFYEGLDSITRGETRWSHTLKRALAQYCGVDTVRRVELSDERLAAIDDNPSWGTFWAVCRGGDK